MTEAGSWLMKDLIMVLSINGAPAAVKPRGTGPRIANLGGFLPPIWR